MVARRTRAQHLALLVHDPGGDLGAADVDPDGQPHRRTTVRPPPARVIRCRSARPRGGAPSTPARARAGPPGRREQRAGRRRPGAAPPRAGSSRSTEMSWQTGHSRHSGRRRWPRARSSGRRASVRRRPRGAPSPAPPRTAGSPRRQPTLSSSGAGDRWLTGPSTGPGPARTGPAAARRAAPRRPRCSGAARSAARAPGGPSPTVRTSSSPARTSSMASRSANGSASVSTNSSPERSTSSGPRSGGGANGSSAGVHLLGERRPARRPRPAPRTGTPHAAPAAARTTRRPRRAAACCALTQPASQGSAPVPAGKIAVRDDGVDPVAEQRQRRQGAARLGHHHRLGRQHQAHRRARVAEHRAHLRQLAVQAPERVEHAVARHRHARRPVPAPGAASGRPAAPSGTPGPCTSRGPPGSASSRSVSAVGAQSTTTTSQRPERTWSRTSSRARTSSAPGQHGQLLGGDGVDAGGVEHCQEVVAHVPPGGLEPPLGVDLLHGQPRHDLDRLRRRRARPARRRGSARRRWTAPASSDRARAVSTAVPAAAVVLPTPPLPVNSTTRMGPEATGRTARRSADSTRARRPCRARSTMSSRPCA